VVAPLPEQLTTEQQQALAERIRKWAAELGFQQVGIAVHFKEDATSVQDAVELYLAGECREFGETETCGGGSGGCGGHHHHHHQKQQQRYKKGRKQYTDKMKKGESRKKRVEEPKRPCMEAVIQNPAKKQKRKGTTHKDHNNGWR